MTQQCTARTWLDGKFVGLPSTVHELDRGHVRAYTRRGQDVGRLTWGLSTPAACAIRTAMARIIGRIALLLAVLASTCCTSAQLFSGGQPSITLRYFDIRGLAEPIRLTLAALGLEYEELKYERCPANSVGEAECRPGVTDWNTAKQEGIASGLLPFGQVPSLTYVDQQSGKTFEMVQSQAILRFLARKHNFYGTSEEEEILCATRFCCASPHRVATVSNC